MVIDETILSDYNIKKRTIEKMSKYTHLKIECECERM